MKIASLRLSNPIGLFLLTVIICLGLAATPCLSGPVPSMTRLPGHIPAKAIAKAKWIERLDSKTEISMAFSLPLRNQQELDGLLKSIYDPADPLYGHYLTSQEFTDRFGPTQSDYDSVAAYAADLGLKITGTHPNRILLDVSGTAAVIESAFGLHLNNY